MRQTTGTSSSALRSMWGGGWADGWAPPDPKLCQCPLTGKAAVQGDRAVHDGLDLFPAQVANSGKALVCEGVTSSQSEP